MIRDLISESLLRSVRHEITTKISFTLKETDIYKIHQSGDLANLDGLDDNSLAELPALLELRNAMYSELFRNYLSEITGAGPLSGRKTDMAINIYKPGCHLLCHDDVIGSRRVSYILYLTDPDNPWQAAWGGALRLYPTNSCKNSKRERIRVPDPDFTASIPPAWNQLSFFAVQPGESFHDVEEVYASGDESQDRQRERIAISGWFHIPQQGESGYEEGLEEKLAKTSSLTQLQNKDEFDKPKPDPIPYVEYWKAPLKALPEHSETTPTPDSEPDTLTDSELDFLLQFIEPKFLVPGTVTDIWKEFTDASFIRLEGFLKRQFAESLRETLSQDVDNLPTSSVTLEAEGFYKVARPPHKHRYLYVEPGAAQSKAQNLLSMRRSVLPLKQLLCQYFPSKEFRKWLRLATGLVLKSHDVKARRFRRGLDYQLATAYEDEDPRLELCLGVTSKGNSQPKTTGSQTKEEAAAADEEPLAESNKAKSKVELPAEDDEPLAEAGKTKSKVEPPTEDDETIAEDEEPDDHDHGGYESYMAGDDGEDDEGDAENETDVKEITVTQASGVASPKPKPKPKTSDPAVYQSASDPEDDSTLFTMAAGWNRLSLVLRDKGTLRFVKYVSAAAAADRWDISGEFEIDWEKTPDFGILEDELAMELEDEEDEYVRAKGFKRGGTSEEETSIDEGVTGFSSEDEDEGLVGSQDVGKTTGFGRRRK